MASEGIVASRGNGAGQGAQREAADGGDVAFLLTVHPAALPAMRRLAALYERLLARLRRHRHTAWLAREHFIFFALASVVLPLLMPRTLALMTYALERFVLGHAVARPALEGWPAMPSLVLPAVAASLLAFFLPRPARLVALLGFSVVSGWFFGYLDALSVGLFGLFVLAAFGVIRLPVSRAVALALLCILALVLLLASVHWFDDRAIAAIGTFQVTLLPMLWYSAYEHRAPRRPLALRRFASYLYLRFFGGPVVTYTDVFSAADGQRLSQVRFAGMKALYIAALASLATAGAHSIWRAMPVNEQTGLSLLAVSYVGYVGENCQLVLAFNVVIGVLRLFGVPLRDNFNYWLLARTPNEHWQRWNLLFREWVVTFVFFPIMKSRRWLFAAVMSSLLVSGFLHIFAAAIAGTTGVFASVLYMLYWTVNGLAIYAVIKVPQRFPRLVSALGMRSSLAWSVFGIVATSSFYAVLHGVRSSCRDWSEVAGFFARLLH